MTTTPVAFVEAGIRASIEVKTQLASIAETIAAAAQLLVETYQAGNKLIAFGNGGSAADAQHIAAELIGRFYVNRRPLPALALSTNSSIVTALANDFGYETVFSRQLEALAAPGDLVLAISTSGTSKNVLLAATRCRELGLKLCTLTGERQTELTALADVAIRVPSADTPRIQECHILVGHLLCDWLERRLFPEAS